MPEGGLGLTENKPVCYVAKSSPYSGGGLSIRLRNLLAIFNTYISHDSYIYR